MSSNSKDQRSLEALYENIKIRDTGEVDLARHEMGHENQNTFNVQTKGIEDDSVKGKLKKLLSDRTLGLPEEIDDSHLESLLAQYGLSDDAGDEEDITGSEVAFSSKDSDSEEDEEDLYPESFNTENYLIATKEAKKNPKASDTTASYLGK